MTEFAQIPLAHITASLTNPRKNFHEGKLAELAESIKASGVHQPVLVRPLPAARVPDTDRAVQYELVAGERRYRASQLAGKADIPAMIRALTDAQVLEIQIVENLQRDDLSELEEAEGYEKLMQHSELTVDQVVEKIGKSRSYVYARLKLLDLCMECKQALRDGRIDSSRALLLARIPDGKLQKKALAFAVEPSGWPAEQPSVRRLQEWLKQNVMLRLDQAVFKITDARLVEAAGSCRECPKRTGANPDLFADVQGADICTDPACFRQKEEAHRAALMKKAEAKGMAIVQGEEAKKLLEGSLWHSIPPGYDDLHQKREDLSQEGERVVTLAQALGKDAPQPILFVHPRTQEMVEIVPSDKVAEVLKAKGHTPDTDYRHTARRDPAEQLEQLRDDAEREIRKETNIQVHAAVQEAVRATTKAQANKLLSQNLLRAWLISEIDLRSSGEVADDIGFECEDEVDFDDALLQHIRRMSEADVQRAVALVMLAIDSSAYSDHDKPIQAALLKDLEIDIKPIERKVKAEVKREFADRIKAVQDKIDAQKAPAATLPAARQAEGAGGEDKAVPKLRTRARKLGVEEAEQGIAAAMQSVEEAAPAGVVAPPADPAFAHLTPQSAWPFPPAPKPSAKSPKAAPTPAAKPAPEHLAKGDKVTVLDTCEHAKRRGKQGKLGDKAGFHWWVNFGGKAGSELIHPDDLRKVA